MRAWVTVAVATLLAAFAKADRILLIPLDSRPAAGQFAQMIGNMDGAEVRLPPYNQLGRFTQPGDPEQILTWLGEQDFSDVSAVIVSTDMICYGGLIASRINDVTEAEAIDRLKALDEIRKRAPNVRFYAYSAVMRLNPTATKATAAWRLDLGRYAALKDRYRRNKKKEDLKSIRNLESKIPSYEIQRYQSTRQRNHNVQKQLLAMTGKGLFDYVIFGQDDAQPYGPHIPETVALRALVTKLAITGKSYFCEGIDQHANVLVSRALLKSQGWTPRVRIVYSDDAGKKKIADYESKVIEESLRDQLLASGARPAIGNQNYDYTLYVNTPGRNEVTFRLFLNALTDEVDQGFPVGVADINLGKDGTSDPELFAKMNLEGRMIKLLSYAGWNTAGNTLGTAIPAANVYLLSRRSQKDALIREIALREFLLHRFVNDYDYHKHVRPAAYAFIRSTPSASQEETYGEAFDEVNGLVRTRLEQHLQSTFQEQFLGKRFFADSKQYAVTGLEAVRIFLPWPRAYEVRLEFKLMVQEVDTGQRVGRSDESP